MMMNVRPSLLLAVLALGCPASRQGEPPPESPTSRPVAASRPAQKEIAKKATAPAPAKATPQREVLRTAPVKEDAVCRVQRSRTDGMGTRREVYRFAADGRMLEGTGSNYYASTGVERFFYDADRRLVRIESREESRHPAGDPTLTSVFFDYDRRGLLARELTESRVPGRFPSFKERRFDYDADRRLRGTMEPEIRREIEYRDDRARRHVAHLSGIYGERDSRWTATRDASGRIASVQMEGCAKGTCKAGGETRYTHDGSGRLVRKELVDPTLTDAGERSTRWRYDGAGRVTSEVRRHVYAATKKVEERPTVYRYDKKGRLLTIATDGKIDTRFAYDGACDRVRLGPEPPSAEELLSSRICITSPIRVLSTCFEPRARAVALGPAVLRAAAPAPPREKNVGEGTKQTADPSRWRDFRAAELGVSARFPETPAVAQRGLRVIAWGRSEPYLVLQIEVYPPHRKLAGKQLLRQMVADLSDTDERNAYGDITHHPKWLRTSTEVPYGGHPALEVAGQYPKGAFGNVVMARRGRLVVVGNRGYFASAIYPLGDSAGARAAAYFLSSLRLSAVRPADR